MTDKKVAILFAPGFEEIEALTPRDLLFRAGIRSDLISITDNLQVTSNHEVTIVCDALLADTDLDQYDMIVLPGGIPGMPNLKAHDTVIASIKDFISNDKPVAAICASPSILAELGILEGKKATSNPGFHNVLVDHGATLLHDPVVIDGRIITSQGAGTSMDFALELVRYFAGDEAVAQVRKAVVLD